MAENLMYGWDSVNEEWVKLRLDADGSIHVVGYVDDLEDIGDVILTAIAANDILYWNAGVSEWQNKAMWTVAHKDTHDPQDGADPLDTAIAVKVGDANAKGTSHSLARADHVHEKHHAKYLDADAVNAMGAKADDNPLHHDRAEEWGADEHTAIGDDAPHHAKYTDAEAVDAIEADDNLPLASITFIIDGGGVAITTGQKGHLRIPFACTINEVTMLADQTGAIVVDIWKSLYVGFPPDDGDSITHETPPTITATNQKSEDSTLAGWTTAIVAGAILAFNVDSCTDIQRVTISLKVTKT